MGLCHVVTSPNRPVSVRTGKERAGQHEGTNLMAVKPQQQSTEVNRQMEQLANSNLLPRKQDKSIQVTMMLLMHLWNSHDQKDMKRNVDILFYGTRKQNHQIKSQNFVVCHHDPLQFGLPAFGARASCPSTVAFVKQHKDHNVSYVMWPAFEFKAIWW